MKIKIYKLLSSAKQGLFAIALTVFSGTAYSQATYTFNYTGVVQTLTLPVGNHKIECWGANGGSITSVGGDGIGGYSKGEFNVVTPGTVLNILVGGKGFPATGSTAAAGAGGWNGGGGGAAVGRSGGGGGGASDVRLSGTAATDRIIVAGGGGGAAYYAVAPNLAPGGNGGAQIGQNGSIITSAGVVTPGGGGQGANGATPGMATVGTASGTATGGGGGGISAGTSIGQPGIGGSYGGAAGPSASGSTGSAGGGGGGYAGGAGGVQTSNAGVAGGGGSGYIGGVTSGVTTMSGTTGFVSNPVVTGNGLVIITELCNITLTSSGPNSTNPSICSGQSLTLTTNAVSNYSWSTGATTSSIVVAPTTNTVYSLAATSVSNCNAFASITVLVAGALPTLTVANSTSVSSNGVCPNKTATLTASGAITYTWAGSNNVTNGSSFTPTVASGYTVTGENGCGISTAVTSVSIHPTPTLSPITVANPTICSGSSTTLTASGSGVSSYSWSTSSTNSTISVSPASNTTYTVIGFNALSCTNSAVAMVTVVLTPTQNPSASPAAFCIGNSSTLTATGGSYTWMPSGANTATIAVTPTAPGVYVYTVTKAANGCADTKTISVTVNPLPSPTAAVAPTVVCKSAQTATLTGLGAIGFTWTPYGGNGANALITASVNTTFTLTATNGSCISTTTVGLSVNPNPTVTAVANPSIICANESATITANGGGNYTWTPSNLSGASVVVSPTTSTAYSVLGDNSFGCTASANPVIIVLATPSLVLSSSSSTICNGSSATLSATGGQAYAWTNGPTTNTNVVNPNQTTTYTVVGTNTASGCTDTKTIDLTVFDLSVTITGNSTICVGESANLNASGAVSCTWNPGGLTFQGISVSPLSTAIYTVSAISSSNSVNCPVSATIAVVVNPTPTVTAVPTKTAICVKETNTITASGASTYTWVTTNTTVTSPTVTATSNNAAVLIFTVTGRNAEGCESSITIPINISACSGIGEWTASGKVLSVYPNPNTGEFLIEAAGALEMDLVNDLGQVVKHIQLKNENEYKVLIENLSNGIYFIVGGTSRTKIVVNK